MVVMLILIFLCIALGLRARRFEAREHLVVAFLATTLTALYYFVAGLT